MSQNTEARERVFQELEHYFNAELRPTLDKREPGKDMLAANGKVVGWEELKNLVDSAMDLWLTAGRYSDAFEKRFAQVAGTRYALLVNSGSSANLVAFSALTSPLLKEKRLVPGDEFITPAAGFPTTVNPALQFGLKPVFVDVDLAIHNFTPEIVEAALTPRTRLVMAAHTLGNPYDSKRIREICDARGIWFVEDCCDALGATLHGQPVGTFGHISTYSFYPAHQITMGEGGAVVTNSSVLKKVAESFRDWGRDCYCPPGKENSCGKRYDWELGQLPKGYDHKYIYTHIGYNLKVSDMQAACGLAQLDRLDGFVAARRDNFVYLSNALKSRGAMDFLELPGSIEGAQPSWFGLLMTLKDGAIRRSVLEKLNEAKVGTRLLFAGNLTRQPAYLDVPKSIPSPLVNTDRVMTSSFYVGVWPGLSEAHLDYIADSIIAAIKSSL